jgi:hypothetical protein
MTIATKTIEVSQHAYDRYRLRIDPRASWGEVKRRAKGARPIRGRARRAFNEHRKRQGSGKVGRPHAYGPEWILMDDEVVYVFKSEWDNLDKLILLTVLSRAELERGVCSQ